MIEKLYRKLIVIIKIFKALPKLTNNVSKSNRHKTSQVLIFSKLKAIQNNYFKLSTKYEKAYDLKINNNLYNQHRTEQHSRDDAEPVTGRPHIHPVQHSVHDGGQPV